VRKKLKKLKMLTLILGKRGDRGVNKQLTNGFFDPKNPFNDGLKNNNKR